MFRVLIKYYTHNIRLIMASVSTFELIDHCFAELGFDRAKTLEVMNKFDGNVDILVSSYEGISLSGKQAGTLYPIVYTGHGTPELFTESICVTMPSRKREREE